MPKALVCVDGVAPDRLLDAALALLPASVVWVPTIIVDAGPRRDLDLLRRGIPGAGPLSQSQRADIDAATSERLRGILEAVERILRQRGCVVEPAQVQVGDPGPEICAIAARTAADLIVLSASHHQRAEIGPRSVGHTARFVLDHAPCPVLLVRGAHLNY